MMRGGLAVPAPRLSARPPVMMSSHCPHNSAFAGDEQSVPVNRFAEWGSAVAEQLDFTQEANGCFRLAEAETDAEIRTILIGMGYGLLTLAGREKAKGNPRHEPFDEPTEEPSDDL